MKVKYSANGNTLNEVARVYSRDEHNIDYSKIDKDAIYVIRKLLDNGFETYLVGGSVRDLYLGKVPKDFDVVTEASPRQVHRIFSNSRIIGRRFRIVHVVFGHKIIEVSTFRSLEDQDLTNDNKFGTVEEDAKRRDFTINSLYYDIENQSLIDFNRAIKDFSDKKITSLIPVSRTFLEDPVRMIRAIKYSCTTGFKMRRNIRVAIKRFAPAISNVSTSRITEEINKILESGYSCQIISLLNSYKLLVYLLPSFSLYANQPKIRKSLEELDRKVMQEKLHTGESISIRYCYLAMIGPLVVINRELKSPKDMYLDILRQFKVFLYPNTPSNLHLENTVRLFMEENGLELPKPVVRKKPEVSKKSESREGYSKRKKKSNNSAPNFNIN